MLLLEYVRLPAQYLSNFDRPFCTIKRYLIDTVSFPPLARSGQCFRRLK
jgi:hypothetical protein